MNRRTALLICVGACSCARISKSPTAPTDSVPTTPPPVVATDLLTAVRNLGYTAQRSAYGNSGASRIIIDGHPNWNFWINDAPVGIGTGSATTVDVATITVTPGARVAVIRV